MDVIKTLTKVANVLKKYWYIDIAFLAMAFGIELFVEWWQKRKEGQSSTSTDSSSVFL